MSFFAVFDTTLLAENDSLKILMLKLLKLVKSSSSNKLTLWQQQSIQNKISLISLTISSTKRGISWLDVQINTNQITILSSLKVPLVQVNSTLASLQSANIAAVSLNTSETTMLVNIVVNFTSILEG